MTQTLARAERAALADLFDAVGPDAPTLCEGWRARELAAHLVVREGTLVASAGIAFKPLAGRHEQAVAKKSAGDYAAVIQRFRSGAPGYSMFAIPSVDAQANGLEIFIHHEDVRRAIDGWQPRELTPEHDAFIWAALERRGKLMFRKVPAGTGVLLRTSDGREARVRDGGPTAVLTGAPGELVMFAYGRKQCQVEVSGDAAAIEALHQVSLGI